MFDGSNQVVQLDALHTSTGTQSESLVLRRFGALLDGIDYTFVVSVQCDNLSSTTATASLELPANTPPTGGSCTMQPTAIVPLEDQVRKCYLEIDTLLFNLYLTNGTINI